MSIYKEDLKFLDEARKAFKLRPDWKTYRDEHDNYIALRIYDDITVYRLDSHVGHFSECLNWE